MKLIHIVAGLLALAAGAVALYASKGSPLHRHSGAVFVAAMLLMTTSAGVMALFYSPNRVNVVAATLTFYLVVTGLLTVRRTVAEMRLVTAALMLIAVTISMRAFDLGFDALASPSGLVDHVPAPPLFLFAIAGLLGAGLDARLLWAGQISGGHRLARHLWRMTFAMWIATTSFFLGQATFFPEPMRKTALLAIPVLLVTFLLFWWLVRVLWKRERAVRYLKSAGGKL